jgi:hypothetical protein
MPEVKRAKNQGEECQDSECKFCSGTCCYGMRNQAGCYMQDKDKHDDMMQSHLALTMLKARKQFEPDLKDDEKDAIKKVDVILDKQFRFIFRGHEYTVSDSARVQSQCPHCGLDTKDGTNWSIESDAYIGTYKDGKNIMRCFECPECSEKFFYHDVRV